MTNKDDYFDLLDQIDHQVEKIRRFAYDARYYQFASLDDRDGALDVLRKVRAMIESLGVES